MVFNFSAYCQIFRLLIFHKSLLISLIVVSLIGSLSEGMGVAILIPRNRLAPPLILSCNPSRFLNGGNVGYYDGALNCYAISLKKKGMLHAKEKIVVYTFYTGLFETSQKKKD